VLVERKELTAGSTWHAAGGMHTLNGDPNVAKLQQYTVELYRKIEERSGQDWLHPHAGRADASGDRERMDWLRMAQARGRYLGMDMEIISAAEPSDVPLLEERYFIGALFDPPRVTSTRPGHPGYAAAAAGRRRDLTSTPG